MALGWGLSLLLKFISWYYISDNEEEKERVLSHFRNIQTKLELILDEEAADYSSPEKR